MPNDAAATEPISLPRESMEEIRIATGNVLAMFDSVSPGSYPIILADSHLLLRLRRAHAKVCEILGATPCHAAK